MLRKRSLIPGNDDATAKTGSETNAAPYYCVDFVRNTTHTHTHTSELCISAERARKRGPDTRIILLLGNCIARAHACAEIVMGNNRKL